MADPTSEAKRRIGEWTLGKKISSGSGGDVYRGHNSTNDEEVAVKLARDDDTRENLEHETEMYKALAGCTGVPSMRWYGSTTWGYGRLKLGYAMVLDALGPNLEELLAFCGGTFSLKTVLLLADQLIPLIHNIHRASIIHCDIKPGNTLMGVRKKGHLVYAVDLAWAKQYRNPHTRQHIPCHDNIGLTGNLRFTSLNSQRGIQLSRRDDLESLAYSLIYFLRGKLPWEGIRAPTRKRKNDLIMQSKEAVTTDVLCAGLPSEFGIFLHYCRALRFGDKPNYDYMRELFRKLFDHMGFERDNVFDWSIFAPSARSRLVALNTIEPADVPNERPPSEALESLEEGKVGNAPCSMRQPPVDPTATNSIAPPDVPTGQPSDGKEGQAGAMPCTPQSMIDS